MDHRDHVNLVRRAISKPGGVWADLGSGEGAFTLALRDLLGPQGEIFSIDRDQGRLRTQARILNERFPNSNIHFECADLARPLSLPRLDGIIMANVLHFFRDKESILRHVRKYLKHEGRLVLIEYNVDMGNLWVPHPLSFETFRQLAPRAGFTEPERLATVPSRFLHEIYSALAFNPASAK